MNLGNTTVDTTAPLNGNATLANAPAASPPAAALTGNLKIAVDGITQQFDYSTVAVNTTSTAATAVGATAITVTNSTGLVAGQVIVVGQGSDQELTTITSVVGNTVNVAALANAHSAGEGVGGNAGTVDTFINSFNAGHYGVTASYSVTSQTIVFARDPTNIDLVHRAAMAAAIPPGTTTPNFTLSDSNAADAAIPVGSAAQPIAGTTATSLLATLGANQINGVNQNSVNAIGVTNGADANALLSLFSGFFGVPAVQTVSGSAIVVGANTVLAAGRRRRRTRRMYSQTSTPATS